MDKMKILLVYVIVLVVAVQQASAVLGQELGQIPTSPCANSPSCDPFNPYRSFTGVCSNLNHSSWGQAGTPFFRWLPPYYEDGKSVARQYARGSALPMPREISTACFPDGDNQDDLSPINVMQWGQLIAHDCSRVVPQADVSPSVQCCSSNNQPLAGLKEQNGCLPIEVSPDDSFFSLYDVSCLFFSRAIAGQGTCPNTPKQQANNVSHPIDASFIYGNTKEAADNLREFSGGRLKMNKTADNREWPPTSSSPSTECTCPASRQACYTTTGDKRTNQNIGITIYTVLFFRLHNYLAGQLSELNPQWNDEVLFNEARRIVWAVVQHITYKQFLPPMLGKSYTKSRGLSNEYAKYSCKNLHDPKVTPAAFAEWSGASFRSFHSLVPRELVLYNENFEPYKSTVLDDWYFCPSLVQKYLDDLIRGLAAQPQQCQDHLFSKTLTQYLYRAFNSSFGQDLVSIDIQRGRDLGLPTYNDVRQLCGFKKIKKFEDLKGIMNDTAVQCLKKTYTSVDNIDLYVGGNLENVIGITYVGPTFQCLNGEQFYNWMIGDRWFYENCGTPVSFTQDQIKALYATTPAWIFCTVGDNITSMQYDTFHLPSKANPVVPCSEIPTLDLSPWSTDYPGYRGVN